MGTLIILEGGDGSGKATQTKCLVERLQAEGHRVRSVSFPNYDSDASMPIKMYLSGQFGTDVDSVNPYVASSMLSIVLHPLEWIGSHFIMMMASLLLTGIRRQIWFIKW